MLYVKKDRENRKREQQTQVTSQSNNVDKSSSDRELDDHNLFDIFNKSLKVIADFLNQQTHSIGTFVLKPILNFGC